MSKPNLPPLPEPVDELARADGFNVIGVENVFTSAQMTAYAEEAVRQALAAQRNDGFASLALWWTMIEADAELAGAPFSDDEPILDFMGSGASHQVTAGDIRAALSVKPETRDG